MSINYRYYHLYQVLFLLICICLASVVARATSYPPQWQKMSCERLNMIAKTYRANNQEDSAVMCYSLSASRLNEAKGNDLKESIKASFWLGNIYQSKYYNYAKAADCLLLAKQAATEINDSMLLSLIYHELGTLYEQYESSNEGSDLAMSLDNLKKAYWYRTENDTIRDLFMFNIVTSALEFKQVAAVLNEVDDYYKQHPVPNYVTHLCQAAKCVERGDLNQAIECVDRSLALVSDKHDEFFGRLATVMHIVKSKLLEQVGRDKESLVELEMYIQLVREYDLVEGIPSYYNQLYHFYEKRGQTDLAQLNRLRYYEAVDSLVGLTQLYYLTKAPLAFDLQKANEEARVQKIHRERMTEIMWIVALAALVFLALMVIIYRRNVQLRASYRTLYEQNLEQLAHLEESRRLVNALQQPLPEPQESSQDKEELMGNCDINEQMLEEIFQRVKAVMETSPEIYDAEFSMSKLNVMVGSNMRYISAAINRFAHCDFKSLLSQYRVQEACRRMNDIEHYGQYTIEAIAKSVGVTSRTSFIQNFKKQTGLTPSAYLKFAREKTATAD